MGKKVKGLKVLKNTKGNNLESDSEPLEETVNKAKDANQGPVYDPLELGGNSESRLDLGEKCTKNGVSVTLIGMRRKAYTMLTSWSLASETPGRP